MKAISSFGARAEVHDFHLPVPADHHVGRLQVAMNDPVFMGVFQGAADPV